MVLQSEKSKTQGSRSKKVLVVDDCVANLTIAKKALDSFYSVFTTESGEKALDLIYRQGFKPALILLDVEMPGIGGLEVIRRLKENVKLNTVPVILMTSDKMEFDESVGFALGAADYLTKPLSVPIMQKRVHTHIEITQQQSKLSRYENSLDALIEKKTAEVLGLQNAVITALLELVDLRNGAQGGAIRTGMYLKSLVDGLVQKGYYSDEVSGMDMDEFVDSARLYDIGEVAVPDHIMKKNARLTSGEFDEIKKHTVIGQQAILKAMQKSQANAFLNNAAVSAVSHHERWDGSGYPYGLSKDEIPLQGRLVAIADAYEAMISDRPYKPALSPGQAINIINQEAGKHFDPRIVEIFNERREEFEKIATRGAV